ncbi:MAG: DUF4271 domain-containing protein [Bacteroidota bacterium]
MNNYIKNTFPQDTLNSILRTDKGIFNFQTDDSSDESNIIDEKITTVDSNSEHRIHQNYQAVFEKYNLKTGKKLKILKEATLNSFNSSKVDTSLYLWKNSELNKYFKYKNLFDLNTNRSPTHDSIKNKYLHKSEIVIHPETNNFLNSESIKSDTKDWLLGILLLSFFFFTGIRFFSGKTISGFFKAAFNYQLSLKLNYDANIFLLRISFLLNILFVINTGIFIYYLSENITFLKNEFTEFQIFLICQLSALLIYFGKYLILKTIGFFLNFISETNEYIQCIFLYNKLFGIILLPLIISYPFIDSNYQFLLIYAGVSIFSLLFILRVLRGIIISIKNKFSMFYIILYLCTLEILPIMILYKFYDSYIGV